MSPVNESDTRERLLDAAEKLFAETGIGATSLRAVTAEAQANLASVHYHFGSKESLLLEVFGRRIKPVNHERLERLDKAMTDAPDDLDAIVRAFVAPALLVLADPEMDGHRVSKLMGRFFSEPAEIKMQIFPLFDEVAERFTQALKQHLPHLSPTELFWRFHYMVGCMAFSLIESESLESRAGSLELGHIEDNIEGMVRFISGGLSAPSLQTPAVAKEADGEA